MSLTQESECVECSVYFVNRIGRCHRDSLADIIPSRPQRVSCRGGGTVAELDFANITEVRAAFPLIVVGAFIVAAVYHQTSDTNPGIWTALLLGIGFESTLEKVMFRKTSNSMLPRIASRSPGSDATTPPTAITGRAATRASPMPRPCGASNAESPAKYSATYAADHINRASRQTELTHPGTAPAHLDVAPQPKPPGLQED